MSASRNVLAALCVLLALGAGCATTGSGDLSRAELEGRIALNPDDWEAHRDLGVLLAAEQNFPRAHEALQRAFERQPQDPKTLYHLGLVNEVLGRRSTAIRLYEGYASVPAASEYRERLRGRYQWLLRIEALNEFRDAMAREEALAPVTGTDALAVLPFNFRAGSSRYRPLGRGLAEMITVDLAGVEGLTVVERVRLQTLLGELELAQSGAVDPETAPRYGRLLRADRLVGGHYGVVDDHLSVDAGIFTAERPDLLPDLSTSAGAIDHLFEVQKQVVRQILDELGVTPTAEQLARLERVPTRNLNAFVSFSRGLLLEDRREYARAADFYERAARLDPDFAMAASKAAECRAIASQAGEPGDLLAGHVSADLVLLGLRTLRLSQTLSQHLVPGTDTRNPAVEGAAGGVQGPLPDPPPPPSGNR